MNDEKMVEIDEQEMQAIQGGAGLPAAEAFCAGGAWHNPHTWTIRFIQDPCNTIDHPMGIH